MKRQFFKRLLLAILAMGLFSACMGMGASDWAYDLPNGYAIWHVHRDNTRIGYKNTENSIAIYEDGRLIGIPGHIVTLCLNDRFVCTKNTAPEEDSDGTGTDAVPVYYILDTKEKAVCGTLAIQEYTLQLQKLQIENLCDWIAVADPTQLEQVLSETNRETA